MTACVVHVHGYFILRSLWSSPTPYAAPLRFNGGGHLNHSIFWENLAPPSKGGGGAPEGELAVLIDAKFGSFDAMKMQLSASAVAVQGSGWGWLGYDKASGSVAIATCANQVSLLSLKSQDKFPIIFRNADKVLRPRFHTYGNQSR